MSSRSRSHTSSRSRMRSSCSASRVESGQLSSRVDGTSPNAEVEEVDIAVNIARNDPHVPSTASTKLVAAALPEAVPLPPSPGSGEGDDAGAQGAMRTGDEGIGVRGGTGSAGVRTRFGLNTEKHRGQPVRGAPRDYKQKYAEDPPYKELDRDARIWLVYNEESAIFDDDMIAESGDNLDILLVFAGLFSTVLTTFVAQTSQALSPDNTAISNSILLEVVALQRAQANGTSFDLIPAANTSFTVSPTDIWVNGFWFTSLALSLSTALLAGLAKQWLRQYSSFIAGPARTRALIRQFRYACFDKWGVRLIISLLPTVLHLSLFLFMVGLVVFLFPLDRTIARVVACIAGVLCGIYIITNVLPIITVRCPYRTPLSAFLYPLYHPARVLAILIFKVTIFIVKLPYIFVRWALGCTGLIEKRRGWLPHVSITLPKRMGSSFREIESKHVEGKGEWISIALSWLLDTTSDPSAKDILVEALGAVDPRLDPVLLAPIFTQQWATIASRLDADGLGNPSDEMMLGRLIRATMFHNIGLPYEFGSPISIMLDKLPAESISAIDHATILAIAACSGTSRFAWRNKPKADLPPHKAFDFILKHYSPEFVAPTWMWWSICTQAVIGDTKGLHKRSNDQARRLLNICTAGSSNISDYKMGAWLEQFPVPVDLWRALEMPENSGRNSHPGSPISLARFLADHFPSIRKGPPEGRSPLHYPRSRAASLYSPGSLRSAASRSLSPPSRRSSPSSRRSSHFSQRSISSSPS